MIYLGFFHNRSAFYVCYTTLNSGAWKNFRSSAGHAYSYCMVVQMTVALIHWLPMLFATFYKIAFYRIVLKIIGKFLGKETFIMEGLIFNLITNYKNRKLRGWKNFDFIYFLFFDFNSCLTYSTSPLQYIE